jgi:hypothetical protein
MPTVYLTIGNSDDKLGQAAWSAFCDDVTYLVNGNSHAGRGRVHAACFSSPAVPWQNAMWSVELDDDHAHALQAGLARLARRYRQEAIAWAQVDQVEMIRPA